MSVVLLYCTGRLIYMGPATPGAGWWNDASWYRCTRCTRTFCVAGPGRHDGAICRASGYYDVGELSHGEA